jgi:hypothetical protein
MDIFFKTEDEYKRVKDAQTYTKNSIAKAYKIKPERVHSIFYLDERRAVKINLTREIASGHLGDTDVLGSQQHTPLFDIRLPDGDIPPNGTPA